MTLEEARRLPEHAKVRYKDKIYDYGYEGQTGKLILYEEGERNMQDSIAVDPEGVEVVPLSERVRWGVRQRQIPPLPYSVLNDQGRSWSSHLCGAPHARVHYELAKARGILEPRIVDRDGQTITLWVLNCTEMPTQEDLNKEI
jgi:hypothetical protein